jgi:hypothetical protein
VRVAFLYSRHYAAAADVDVEFGQKEVCSCENEV